MSARSTWCFPDHTSAFQSQATAAIRRRHPSRLGGSDACLDNLTQAALNRRQLRQSLSSRQWKLFGETAKRDSSAVRSSHFEEQAAAAKDFAPSSQSSGTDQSSRHVRPSFAQNRSDSYEVSNRTTSRPSGLRPFTTSKPVKSNDSATSSVSNASWPSLDIPVSQQVFAAPASPTLGLLQRTPSSENTLAVTEYLQSLGIGKDIVEWVQQNIPELFDLDVESELKPGYRSLFELKHPPTSVLSQFKTIITVIYLRQINVPDGVIKDLTSGNVSELADNIQDHVKFLVEIIREAGMDEKSLMQAWSQIPEFFSGSYLSKLHDMLDFLLNLGVDRAMCVGFIMANQDGISELQQLVDYLHIELGLQDKEVSQVLRGYPPLVMQSVDANVKPVVDYLKTKGLRRSQMAQLVEEFPSVLGCEVQFLDDMYRFLFTILNDEDLVLRALMSRQETSRDGGRSRLEGLQSTYNSFIEAGMTPECVRTMTIRFPGFWNCDLKRKSVNNKLDYWCQELGFTAQDLVGVPEYLSYSLEEDVGPRVSYARAAAVPVSLSNLPYMLAMSESGFAESVCRKSKEDFEQFKQGWRTSREGRKWHLLSNDIPGGSTNLTLGGDGIGATATKPSSSAAAAQPKKATPRKTPQPVRKESQPASNRSNSPSTAKAPPRTSSVQLTGDGM